jgi:hypothetical protein
MGMRRHRGSGRIDHCGSIGGCARLWPIHWPILLQVHHIDPMVRGFKLAVAASVVFASWRLTILLARRGQRRGVRSAWRSTIMLLLARRGAVRVRVRSRLTIRIIRRLSEGTVIPSLALALGTSIAATDGDAAQDKEPEDAPPDTAPMQPHMPGPVCKDAKKCLPATRHAMQQAT